MMLEINKNTAGKIVREDNVKPFKTPAQKRQWRILLGVVVLIVAMAAGAYLLLIPGEKSYLLKDYETVVLRQGDLVRTAQASGSVAIPVQMELVSPEKGYAERLYVHEGVQVSEGDLLARLSAPELEDQKEDLEAELRDARLNLKKVKVQNGFTTGKMQRSLVTLESEITDTEQEVAKLEELVTINASRRSDLENARDALRELLNRKREEQIALREEQQLQALDLEIREANIRQLETRFVRLEQSMENLSIRTPMQGEILEYEPSLGVPGSLITAGQFLFIIADPASAIAELEILEDYAGFLRTGQEISLTVSGREQKGKVLSVGKIAQMSSDGLGSTVQIKVQPLGTREGFLLGSTAIGTIELDKKEGAMLLPRGPYLTTGSQKYLYKVEGDKAVRVTVTFGAIQGNEVEVLKGVEPGDEIIVSGYQNFIEYKEIRLEKGE